MFKIIAQVQIVLLLLLTTTLPSVNAKSDKSDKSNKSSKKTPVEEFCQEGYSEFASYEEFNGEVQIVCATELLHTPPSEEFRHVVRDTTIFPVCMAKDALAAGLIASLSDFVEDALTTALEESTALTNDSVNAALAAIELGVNASLDGASFTTNESLSTLTSGINSSLNSAQAGFTNVDSELNKVNERVADGIRPLKDKARNWIKSLDNHDLLPDFINEGNVDRDFNGLDITPGNLNITNVTLGTVNTPLVSIGHIEIEPIAIEAPEISIPEDPIEALLDLVNICSYPEQYVDLLLFILGFEEAVDLASGNIGIPELVPAFGEAVRMCSVRGGHICSEEELDIIGRPALPGEWAGGTGEQSEVVWMPGSRMYSSPYPPIQPNAINLFSFPRQVPVQLHAPVYPNGNFSCCSVSRLKINRRGKLSHLHP